MKNGLTTTGALLMHETLWRSLAVYDVTTSTSSYTELLNAVITDTHKNNDNELLKPNVTC